MKQRFLIPVILIVGLGLTLSFQPGLFPSLSTGVQSLYAQGSQESTFWVFDGHMCTPYRPFDERFAWNRR